MLPGAHRVKATLTKGFAEYWYAWRGGPRILSCRAATLPALARAVAAATPAAIEAFKAHQVKPAESTAVLAGVITAYLASPDPDKPDLPPPHLAHLSPRTRKDRRKRLDAAREDLGALEVAALGSTPEEIAAARSMLLAWRDAGGAHPHTADAKAAALAMALAWALDRQLVPANPLAGDWPKIYHVNRAEIVWEKAQLIPLLKGAPEPFRRAVLFSIFSGLRGSDVVRVTWAHIGKDAIRLPTGKSTGKKFVIVPIIPPMRALLATLTRSDIGTVLTSSTGEPWSFSGLQTAIQRRKQDIGATLKGYRWHDLRGTAATRYIRAGLPVADVALIMGWDRERTQALASYVTAEAVAQGMLARLKGERRRGAL